LGREDAQGIERGFHLVVGRVIDKPFYVYVLCRPTGEPFYVGMGTGDRILVHEKNARHQRSYKSSIIKSIWASGHQVRRTILERFDTAAEALALEVELIRVMGRRDLGHGPLSNLTDGGDGVLGLSEETRALHRQMTSIGMSSQDVREKCLRHAERLWANPSWAADRVAELRAYWSNPDNRKAQSERVKRHFSDPSVLAAHKARQKEALSRPEVRAKMRAAKLGRKQDPSHIAKRLEALRRPRKPGTGARISAGKRAASAARKAAALAADT
jgi:hypothetical protein